MCVKRTVDEKSRWAQGQNEGGREGETDRCSVSFIALTSYIYLIITVSEGEERCCVWRGRCANGQVRKAWGGVEGDEEIDRYRRSLSNISSYLYLTILMREVGGR